MGPNGEPEYSRDDAPEGKFAFTAGEGGMHRACFTNHGKSRGEGAARQTFAACERGPAPISPRAAPAHRCTPPTRVAAAPVPRRVAFDFAAGANAKDYSEASGKGGTQR